MARSGSGILAMASSTALSPFALSAFSSCTRALIAARSPSISPLDFLVLLAWFIRNSLFAIIVYGFLSFHKYVAAGDVKMTAQRNSHHLLILVQAIFPAACCIASHTFHPLRSTRHECPVRRFHHRLIQRSFVHFEPLTNDGQ